MKKITLALFTLFLLTSCYQKPEDTKKIEELESQIKQQETQLSQVNNINIDILKGEWFTPHYAPRKIIFYIDNTYVFNEDESNVLNGTYNLDGNKVILQNGNGNIELHLSGGDGDDTNFYLKNDEGEYFIKN